jgi:hydroxymethylpyrimidine/phosphomethylpyrimidine kinase
MVDKNQATILLFSGLDPTGGAGIQADIETITSLGATACSIVTALTVQDTNSVQTYTNVDSTFIEKQARCILDDININCIKVGMLADEKIINVVSTIINDYPEISLIIDPIYSAGGGGELTQLDSFKKLLSELIPKATIITPNSIEARALAAVDNLAECAEYILNTGCQAVLITGTHESGSDVCNTLYSKNQVISNSWPRLPDSYHGSGCTLSSSIAAYLALGQDLESAVYKAQQYTYNTLLNARKIGRRQLIPNRFFAKNNNNDK